MSFIGLEFGHKHLLVPYFEELSLGEKTTN